MTILLSRACEYGIQSVLYLAYKGDVGPIHQKKIAEDLHIPTSFLGKILQMLVKKHIITYIPQAKGQKFLFFKIL